MHPTGEIKLTRDIEAIQIPSGDPVHLPAGLAVYITQSLGGTYTVATEHGLARLSSRDADALGIDTSIKASDSTGTSSNIPKDASDLELAIWKSLRQVYDPEIPVNIVDLGLVYDCQVVSDAEKTSVVMKMTLTAPGCGMGPTIAADARSRILEIPNITDAQVDLVWDPAWTRDMMSEEGKMKLGIT